MIWNFEFKLEFSPSIYLHQLRAVSNYRLAFVDSLGNVSFVNCQNVRFENQMNLNKQYTSLCICAASDRINYKKETETNRKSEYSFSNVHLLRAIDISAVEKFNLSPIRADPMCKQSL